MSFSSIRERPTGSIYPPTLFIETWIPDTDSAIVGRRGMEVAGVSLWQRQNLRRAEIFRQTRVLLGHVGYAAFSIRKVAENCDMSPQTVYNLVGDREKLLSAATAQHLHALIAAARELQGPPGFFMAYADIVWGHSLKNAEYARTVSRAHFSSCCMRTSNVRSIMQDVFLAELLTLRDSGQLRDSIDVGGLAERMQSLVAITAMNWVEDPGDETGLRRQLTTGLGLLLLGAMKSSARTALEEWTDAIQTSGKAIPSGQAGSC